MNRIDYEYYEWLVSQIHIPNGKSYGGLFERMHNLEFVWTVPNDDNRVQDGVDLRGEFLEENGGRKLALTVVTFLEVLVALSRRVAFTAGGDADRWAWKLMKNIHVHKFSDPLNLAYPEQIEDRLNTVIWRTYRPDGHGGFFPLSNPSEDQTKVEIWYQMNKYVIEMHAR